MIKQIILNHVKQVIESLDLASDKEFIIEVPNKSEFGDYSTNAALVLAKDNKKPPRDLANLLIKELKKNKNYKKVEIAGPGFINFFLSSHFYQNVLWEIFLTGMDYGQSEHGKGEKVLLEFVSANPTGPLNIVSARAAAFGDTMYRVMKYVGFEPAREFYINDAGNQVDILAESVELRLRELHGESIGDFPFEAYHGEYVKHLAQKLNSVEGVRVFMLPEKDRMDHLKEFALSELL
jgi:arginyl-tRNA synthetase